MQTHILTCARLGIIQLWKSERKLNLFPHCGTPSLWFFIGGQSVGMGATRNLILLRQQNSVSEFQWQTLLRLRLSLRPKYFVRMDLIQQASAKTQAVIWRNLDHQEGFYPKIVKFLSDRLESCSTGATKQRYPLMTRDSLTRDECQLNVSGISTSCQI